MTSFLPVLAVLIVLVLLWYLLRPNPPKASPFHPPSLPSPEPESLSPGRLLLRAFLVLLLALAVRVGFEYYPRHFGLDAIAAPFLKLKAILASLSVDTETPVTPRASSPYPRPLTSRTVPAKKAASLESIPPPASTSVYPLLAFEAMAAYDKGRFPQAIARFQRLSQAEPRNGWAEYLLAWSYWKAGKAVPANHHLSHACRLGYAAACRLARQTCRLKEPGACGDLNPLPSEPPPDRNRLVSPGLYLSSAGRPLPVPDGTPVRITLHHDGQPDSQFTKYLIQGRLTLKPLPAGAYRLTLHVDEDGDGQPTPGDWYFQNRILLKDAQVSLSLKPARILRLQAPVDSTQALDGGEDEIAVEVHSPVQFAWEGLKVPDVRYDYAVVRIRRPFRYERVVAEGSTRNTRITLKLPPSPPQAFHVFLLSARQGEDIVGLLATHGHGWYHWGLRFR